MKRTLILARTAKGIQAAKAVTGEINYDAVRLLRMVNGKASITELRQNFEDLTDARFKKAMVTLEQKGYARILAVSSEGFEDEVLQTLNLRAPQSARKAAPAAPTTRNRRASQHDTEGPTRSDFRRAGTARKARHPPETAGDADQLAALTPKVEEELRVSLTAALRPKVEAEIRHQLIASLRPGVEEEIRAELIAILTPQLEPEVRAQLSDAIQRTRDDSLQLHREPSARAAAEKHSPEPDARSTLTVHQRLLDCMNEAVFQVDLAGKYVYANPAWTQLSGYAHSDTLGRRLADFFAEQDRHAVTVCLERIAHGRKTPPVLEASLARKVGGPLRVEMQAAALTAASGEIVGVCGTLRDARRATPA